MFKAVLIVFVLSIGQKGDEQGGGLNAVPFQTMQQCQESIVHMKDVMDDWKYNKGKDDEKAVPVLYTAKCFPITPAPVTGDDSGSGTTAECLPPPILPNSDEDFRPIHKRWDMR